MPYWDIVTRSFRIPWNHKYMWLIAFFSGSTGASFNSSYQQRTTVGRNAHPDFAGAQQQINTWVVDNLGLILILLVLSLVVAIGFFILAAVCEAATVRAAAEHDAERPFNLRMAWQAGVARMWVMVRFRLLLFLFYLPVAVALVAWLVALLIAIAGGSGTAIVVLILVAVPLFLIFVVVAVYLAFLDRFGSRSIVLELLNAWPSVVRAHHLLFKRLGRSLLVWLLSIAVGIVISIALATVAAITLLPLVLLAFNAAGGGASWAWVALGAVIAIPVTLVISGFFAAQNSTYWTVAFRRLDVEYPSLQ